MQRLSGRRYVHSGSGWAFHAAGKAEDVLLVAAGAQQWCSISNQSFIVQVSTEDEEPLEDTAAEQGLVLRLAPAGRGRDQITVSMEPGAGISTL